jgi:long-chain fatty acid transport protein
MFANPMDPSGNSFLALYPDAPAAWATGFGFQAGLHAALESGINASLSYKSKQSFQDFAFEPTTPGASDFEFRLDYPAIISAGVAYTGMEGLTLAADIRYIDFENTPGFDQTGFGAQGQVLGFGWSSITVVAIGAQYEVAPGVPVRLGYAFNGNPIDEDTAFFNTPAPAIIEQHVSGGFSYRINEKLQFSLAAQLGLENEVSGDWKSPMFPGGTNPGTSVTNTLSTLTVVGGVHIGL